MKFVTNLDLNQNQLIKGTFEVLSTDPQLAHVLGKIDHQTGAHGLAALAGATAAGHDGDFQVAANGQREADVRLRPGKKHAGRHDLVDRCIGGVAATVRSCKQDLAPGFLAQAARQQGGDFIALPGRTFIDLAS